MVLSIHFHNHNNILFEEQKAFEECRNKKPLKFDFFLPNVPAVIEFQGKQHYVPINYFGGDEKFIKQTFNDKKKEEYCLKHNINLITIRYDDDVNYMLESIGAKNNG